MATHEQLQRAYRLIKDGNKQEALRILVPLVRAEKNNADAWWLLANAVADETQARRALEQVLRLRPNDEKARRMLDRLSAASMGYGGDPFAAGPTPRSSRPVPSDPFGAPSPRTSADPYAGMDSDPFGPPGGYGQQPGYGAPMPQPERRRRGCSCFTCLLFIVVLLVACTGLTLVAAIRFSSEVITILETANPQMSDLVATAFSQMNAAIGENLSGEINRALGGQNTAPGDTAATATPNPASPQGLGPDHQATLDAGYATATAASQLATQAASGGAPAATQEANK